MIDDEGLEFVVTADINSLARLSIGGSAGAGAHIRVCELLEDQVQPIMDPLIDITWDTTNELQEEQRE